MADYEVAAIIDSRRSGSERQYLIQWANSWVSEHNLIGCKNLLNKFWAAKGRQELSQNDAKDHEKVPAEATQETDGTQGVTEAPETPSQTETESQTDTKSDKDWEIDDAGQEQEDSIEEDDEEEWEPKKKIKKKTPKEKDLKPKTGPKSKPKVKPEAKETNQKEESNETQVVSDTSDISWCLHFMKWTK